MAARDDLIVLSSAFDAAGASSAERKALCEVLRTRKMSAKSRDLRATH
jgi:hypothetical protein